MEKFPAVLVITELTKGAALFAPPPSSPERNLCERVLLSYARADGRILIKPAKFIQKKAIFQ
jgi:hypothetical protein